MDDLTDPDVADPEDAANVQAMEYWDRVVADLEATAAEYEEQGWNSLQLHPGDVTPLSGKHGDRVGLDVLVPDDEYRELAALLEDGVSFDAYQVFKAESAGMVYLVVAMEDADARVAVLYPAYYRAADPAAQGMLERAHDDGGLRSYVRRLSGEYVELDHDDPSLFAPTGESDEASDDDRATDQGSDDDRATDEASGADEAADGE